MANTLKIALILIGILLIGYGLYTVIFPGISPGFGSFQVETAPDNTQSYAMIGLGLLMLVGGVAYKRR